MAKRIAVIDRETCKPDKCTYLCKRVCPINRSGDDCVTVSQADQKPLIDESACIGCGICSHKCPTKAISIINLPAGLDETPVHRYGRNEFVLYRLPVPRPGMVVGLVGQNGIGKSTALNILSGELQPNMGDVGGKAGWEELLGRFKGTELQDYIVRLRGSGVKVAYKPQNVDLIPKRWKGRVSDLLRKADERQCLGRLSEGLGLGSMMGKDVTHLSGGELQLLATAATLLRDADLYFFDEPSSYLDVEQRLRVAREIRAVAPGRMVMVVEHDLAVADYLADQVHILYGRPACFGIISKPQGVRTGINTYLEGFVKDDNVRFRDEPVFFSRSPGAQRKSTPLLPFPPFSKSFGAFSLKTEGGTINRGEIIGVLGPNATGKTTFIRMLTGKEKPDSGSPPGELRLAYKPQRIELTDAQAAEDVRGFLRAEIADMSSPKSGRIMRMLDLERLMDKRMGKLSGGELQAVMIASALGKDFDVILLDEPTAFLDVEQRLKAAKIIREVVEGMEAAAFVVDHDLQILDSVSDRVMVFEGERGVRGHGRAPSGMREGLNAFLAGLGITFRRDPQTGRARANKPGSVLDREQKEKGEHFYT